MRFLFFMFVLLLARPLNAQIFIENPSSGGGAGAASSNVVQVISVGDGGSAIGTTTIPMDDSIPQNTEGTQFLTATITPTNSVNRLMIDVTLYVSINTSSLWVIAALFQDNTASALTSATAWHGTNVTGIIPISFHYSMVAGTTSATTFRVRAGGSGSSTVTLNGVGGSRFLGGSMTSTITITEVVP